MAKSDQMNPGKAEIMLAGKANILWGIVLSTFDGVQLTFTQITVLGLY